MSSCHPNPERIVIRESIYSPIVTYIHLARHGWKDDSVFMSPQHLRKNSTVCTDIYLDVASYLDVTPTQKIVIRTHDNIIDMTQFQYSEKYLCRRVLKNHRMH